MNIGSRSTRKPLSKQERIQLKCMIFMPYCATIFLTLKSTLAAIRCVVVPIKFCTLFPPLVAMTVSRKRFVAYVSSVFTM